MGVSASKESETRALASRPGPRPRRPSARKFSEVGPTSGIAISPERGCNPDFGIPATTLAGQLASLPRRVISVRWRLACWGFGQKRGPEIVGSGGQARVGVSGEFRSKVGRFRTDGVQATSSEELRVLLNLVFRQRRAQRRYFLQGAARARVVVSSSDRDVGQEGDTEVGAPAPRNRVRSARKSADLGRAGGVALSPQQAGNPKSWAENFGGNSFGRRRVAAPSFPSPPAAASRRVPAENGDRN